jgi:hypothetical protein
MKRSVVAICLTLALVLPITFMGALIAIAGEDVSPSQKALEEIPTDLLPLYQSAASTCEGLEWTILAAIHKVETNFGRGSVTSSRGAQGPMQFMRATWSAYAVDGDADGIADIDDVDDAVYSAANLLCANGAGDPGRLADAIWNYNHSDEYVTEVLDLAASYGVVTIGSLTVSSTPSDLLRNPRITLTSNASADLEAGVVDARLIALLDALSRRHTIGISVFKTGHSKYTRSGNVSLHYYGGAVDIFFVDGVPVSSVNMRAKSLLLEAVRLPRPVRPDELGHPFAALAVPGGFTDADHRDHIHLGFD